MCMAILAACAVRRGFGEGFPKTNSVNDFPLKPRPNEGYSLISSKVDFSRN